MNDDTVLEELFSSIDKDELMPNIPMPTLGGEVFWNTITEHDGWRLQQNVFTQHARILNSFDVRIAWGSIRAMTRMMDRIAEILKRNGAPAGDTPDAPDEQPHPEGRKEDYQADDDEEDIETI